MEEFFFFLTTKLLWVFSRCMETEIIWHIQRPFQTKYDQSNSIARYYLYSQLPSHFSEERRHWKRENKLSQKWTAAVQLIDWIYKKKTLPSKTKILSRLVWDQSNIGKLQRNMKAFLGAALTYSSLKIQQD